MSRFSYLMRSFLTGVARLVDFGGQIDARNPSRGGAADADAQAIYSDWLAVGNDIRRAARSFGKTTKS